MVSFQLKLCMLLFASVLQGPADPIIIFPEQCQASITTIRLGVQMVLKDTVIAFCIPSRLFLLCSYKWHNSCVASSVHHRYLMPYSHPSLEDNQGQILVRCRSSHDGWWLVKYFEELVVLLVVVSGGPWPQSLVQFLGLSIRPLQDGLCQGDVVTDIFLNVAFKSFIEPIKLILQRLPFPYNSPHSFSGPALSDATFLFCASHIADSKDKLPKPSLSRFL
jgi:hypothetical protein